MNRTAMQYPMRKLLVFTVVFFVFVANVGGRFVFSGVEQQQQQQQQQQSFEPEREQWVLSSPSSSHVPKEELIVVDSSSILPKIPKNLEYSIDLDVPIPYPILRREMLSNQSDFWEKIVMTNTLKYKQIQRFPWDRYPHLIGTMTSSSSSPTETQKFIGATRQTEYLMPKTLLVSASMAYETAVLTDYKEDSFVLSRITKTPDAPFGTYYVAKTQIVVIRTSPHSTRMICSVETDFPNGPPLGMGWQIRKGMKDGTMDVFQKMGQVLQDYATHLSW